MNHRSITDIIVGVFLLRTFQRLFLIGLFAAAACIIFNCVGYLTVTIVYNDTFTDHSSLERAAQLGPGQVVAFSTPDLPVLAPLFDLNLFTPIPLLPTITPGPPPETPAAAETGPPPQPSRPSATAQPGQLEVISHKSYVDSLGWYHIVGEVQNNSSAPMEFVEVMAKLYNTQQEVIGTKLTFTSPDVIMPGGSASFDIIALREKQWSEISDYNLHVKGDVSTKENRQNLIVRSQNGRIEDGRLIVTGEIENTGPTPALAKLVVTLYDAEHNVLNTSWSYADNGIIAPAGISTFEVKIDHNTDPNNFSYSLQIEEALVDTGTN